MRYRLLFIALSVLIFLIGPLSLAPCLPALQLDSPDALDQLHLSVARPETLGGLRILRSAVPSLNLPDALSLPAACTDGASLRSLTVHLVLSAIILAHLVLLLIAILGKRAADRSSYISATFAAFLLGTVFITLLMAAIGAFMALLFMTIPSFAAWIAETTTVHTANYAAFICAMLFYVITLVWRVLTTEMLTTLWERLLFAAEILLLHEELLLLFFNIDAFVLIASVPFPHLAPGVNPFFPTQWQWWLKSM